VVMLLRDEPELLAIADAVAATQQAILPETLTTLRRRGGLRARVRRVWEHRRRGG
jgi:hypothetical protein